MKKPKKQLRLSQVKPLPPAAAVVGGLITEIGFPACDGAAKDAAFMTL